MSESHPDLPPTPGQIKTLIAYVETESLKGAAHKRQIRMQSVKNHLGELYKRLDVDCAIGAVKKMGWITLPENDI